MRPFRFGKRANGISSAASRDTTDFRSNEWGRFYGERKTWYRPEGIRYVVYVNCRPLGETRSLALVRLKVLAVEHRDFAADRDGRAADARHGGCRGVVDQSGFDATAAPAGEVEL
jgi:hypothetical protein